jgi:hypothetical protein
MYKIFYENPPDQLPHLASENLYFSTGDVKKNYETPLDHSLHIASANIHFSASDVKKIMRLRWTNHHTLPLQTCISLPVMYKIFYEILPDQLPHIASENIHFSTSDVKNNYKTPPDQPTHIASTNIHFSARDVKKKYETPLDQPLHIFSTNIHFSITEVAWPQ